MVTLSDCFSCCCCRQCTLGSATFPARPPSERAVPSSDRRNNSVCTGHARNSTSTTIIVIPTTSTLSTPSRSSLRTCARCDATTVTLRTGLTARVTATRNPRPRNQPSRIHPQTQDPRPTHSARLIPLPSLHSGSNVDSPTCPAFWPRQLRLSLSTLIPETQSVTSVSSFRSRRPACSSTALGLAFSHPVEIASELTGASTPLKVTSFTLRATHASLT